MLSSAAHAHLSALICLAVLLSSLRHLALAAAVAAPFANATIISDGNHDGKTTVAADPQIPKPPEVKQVVVPYSPSVRFYTSDGRLALAYSSASKPGAAFYCMFGGRSRNSSISNLTYSVTLLAADPAGADSAVSIQGRLVLLLKEAAASAAASPRRFVLACSVSYAASARYSVTEWNILVIDPQVKEADSLAWSKPDWLSQTGALELTSAKESPLKSEVNTVACQVAMTPGGMEFARLSLKQNGRRLQLLPKDLQFAWQTEGGKLTCRSVTTYTPDAGTAADTFQCGATDAMRFTGVAKTLLVPYKAGVSRVHMVNSGTGDILTSDSTITEADSLTCQADVAVPAVTYRWRVMRSGSLTNVDGVSISLKGVNLYYPICCWGENTLEGKTFKAKTCENMRGNATFNTENFFDIDGKREKALICGRRSTMGIVQIRFSEKKCNMNLLNETAVDNHCDTSRCVSDTALGQVRRICKKREDGCFLDTTMLMDPVMKSALMSKDTLDRDCFDWAGGVTRIEVDYFCTSPTFIQFDVTGTGSMGHIQTYYPPRTGCYEIAARGGSGGNHTTSYGSQGAGTWSGGKGAESRGRFLLQRGLQLSIVVGQHGGNSTEISPTHRPSLEDNAGTGGGGGSFVYSGFTLYLAAGGGGGASYSRHGVPGQAGTNGSDSDGPNLAQKGRGGRLGGAGWTNTEAASYHGGSGGGWLSTASRRAGPEHGGPGHGGPLSRSEPPFAGGVPGGMNSGAVGGFGGGGGGSEDNGASGGGGGYSGGGAGTHDKQAGGGGGSFCNGTLAATAASCESTTGGNSRLDGQVTVYYLGSQC